MAPSIRLWKFYVLLFMALVVITLQALGAPVSEAAPHTQATPTGIEFQVQRIIPTVAAGPTQAIQVLTDDQPYAFPPYHFITTDRNGEALLKGELNGEMCSIYVFQHTTLLQNFIEFVTGDPRYTLVERSCPRGSAGNTICAQAGAAVFNACTDQLIRTPGAPSTLCNGSLYNPADATSSLDAPRNVRRIAPLAIGSSGPLQALPLFSGQAAPVAQGEFWCPCMIRPRSGWVFTAYIPEIALTMVIPFEGEATVDFISSTAIPAEHFALFYNADRLQLPGFSPEQPYTFDRLQEIIGLLAARSPDLIPWLCRTRGHARTDNVLFPILEFLDAFPRSDRLNMRTGPGAQYLLRGTYSRGAGLNVTGKNAAGGWLRVSAADGREGWMAAWLSELCIEPEDVPVVASPPLPIPSPTPSPTLPTFSPLPTPTDTPNGTIPPLTPSVEPTPTPDDGSQTPPIILSKR